MMPSIAPVLAATIGGAASDADGGQDRVSGVMSSRDARSPFFDRRGHVEIHDRNLPHWQQREVWVFVTWRLADSLPAEKLAVWNEEKARWLTAHPRPWNSAVAAEYREQFTARMEAWLDAGEGSCLLRDAGARKIVGGALAYFDHSRYELGDYVVMPNHVHVLVRIGSGQTLPGIMHTWKS